jgi:hypothetical protein
MEPSERSQRFPSLAQANQDLNTAMTVADEHGRVQYAHAAKDYAAEVACDPQSSLEEKVAARGIMVKAMGITGELSKFSRTHQAEISTPSYGVEFD